MHSIKARIATLFLLLGIWTVPAPPGHAEDGAPHAISDSTLHRLHEVLFETWLPIDSLPLPDSLRAAGRRIGSELWDAVRHSESMRLALARLADLSSLERDCFDRDTTGLSTGAGSFADLDLADRDALFLDLFRCENNDVRRLARQLRVTYLTAIYASRFGRAVAGVPADTTSGGEGTAVAAPSFPPTWLANDSLHHRVVARDGRIDDLIVGSGPAGSVLAHELRRAGRRVVLLDQGPLVSPGRLNTRAKSELLESGGRRASSSGGVLFNNAQAVGGGTTVNIDLVFSPTHPSVQRQLARWRADGRIGPDQYTLQALQAAERWVRAKLWTRAPSQSEINRNNRVLWDGALRHGLQPKLYELNTYPPGKWPTPHTDKRSAVAALLLPAMQEPENPLALIPDARVVRVLIENGPEGRVARGVQFVAGSPWAAEGILPDPLGLHLRRGDTLTVRAGRVFLSAGTLGSAAILLQSDVPDTDVGRGIVGHVAVPVIGLFNERVDAFLGTPATVYVDDYALSQGFLLEAMSAGPEYVALMVPGTGRQVFEAVRQYRHLAGFGVMLIDSPSPENRIALDSSGRPIIHYELSIDDRNRLRSAIAEGVRIMFEAGARTVFLPSHEDIYGGPGEPLAFTSARQAEGLERKLRILPNATVLTSAHLQGSNKMGTQDAGAVVDTQHRVWGVRGLYVMDSSVFPSSIGANPMESIYVLAKLFADAVATAKEAPPRE
jgi:choline dehydrogenase-like flavoprotein